MQMCYMVELYCPCGPSRLEWGLVWGGMVKGAFRVCIDLLRTPHDLTKKKDPSVLWCVFRISNSSGYSDVFQRMFINAS